LMSAANMYIHNSRKSVKLDVISVGIIFTVHPSTVPLPHTKLGNAWISCDTCYVARHYKTYTYIHHSTQHLKKTAEGPNSILFILKFSASHLVSQTNLQHNELLVSFILKRTFLSIIHSQTYITCTFLC
jgi:hypothetical protein